MGLSQFLSLYFSDCLSHKRDIFNQIENFHVCNLNMNIAVRILNFDQKERKIADYKQKYISTADTGGII